MDLFEKYITKILAAAMLMLAAACGSSHEQPLPDPDPDPIEPAIAPRTVLVYMVATNNLGTGRFDTADINEMCDAAAEGKLGDNHLVVYHASSKGVVLKEITKEGIDTLKQYDTSVLSVSIERMREVIADTKELAPACDYGLVLWSHASGWLQDGIDETTTGSGATYSYGSDGFSNPKRMNITSLAEAVSDAAFSFIYFDCCYMGSVEVAYQMRRCTPVIVCSPAEVPANGMPYDLNIEHLFNIDDPLVDVMTSAARTTFDVYNDVFKTGDCPCTMTVVLTAGMDALASATADIYTVASRRYDIGVDYQRFQTGTNCYYYDLEQYVESICDDENLLAAWKQALHQAVPYAAATPYIWSSFPIEHCCGLSTYILMNEQAATTKGYNTTAWYADVASRLPDI